VVIEEDGKTEEEFVGEILATNQELVLLAKEARQLENLVSQNILQLAGEQ
jgi:type I restriction enzyme M protein